jgi:hypothetical protein
VRSARQASFQRQILARIYVVKGLPSTRRRTNVKPRGAHAGNTCRKTLAERVPNDAPNALQYSSAPPVAFLSCLILMAGAAG